MSAFHCWRSTKEKKWLKPGLAVWVAPRPEQQHGWATYVTLGGLAKFQAVWYLPSLDLQLFSISRSAVDRESCLCLTKPARHDHKPFASFIFSRKIRGASQNVFRVENLRTVLPGSL